MRDTHTLYDDGAPNVTGVEAELCEEISGDVPWALVEEFSTLERVSGSDDEEEAAAYIAEQLSRFDVPHETYEPKLRLSIPEDASVTVTEPDRTSFESAKTVAFSDSGTATGELVYIENRDDEIDSIASMIDVSIDTTDEDLEGKIIVSEAIIPIAAIDDLIDAGVAGFIGIHPHEVEPHEGIITPTWGGIPHPDELPEEKVLIANLSNREGRELAELAAEPDPVTVELRAETTDGWFDCPVVVARIPGEAAPETDDFVLLHGHYDSWHVGVTDNATGNAGLLESARVFDEFRDDLVRDLWVAWWPGHSTGRYGGSTWFVDAFAHDLADRCVVHVNMDSPGVADATEFDRVKWMPELDDLCRSVVEDVAGKEAPGDRPSRAGDYSFNNLGIPGASLQSSIPASVAEERGYHMVGGSGGHADAWHLTTDTIDKADREVLVRDIQVFSVAVYRLLTEPILPFDVGHAIDRHREVVREYDDVAGDHFDLEPIQRELELLGEAVDDLVAAGEEGSLDAADVNEHLVAVSRVLTRVNFDSEGRFEQDPALPRPPYPALEPVTVLPDLDGDEYRCQQVHLYRARNGIEYDLKEVRRSLAAHQ